MPRRELAVEQSTRAKLAGDHRGPGPEKRRGPHRWALVRPASDFSGSGILAVDSCQGCRVERTREAAVQLEWLRDRRRQFRQCKSDARDVSFARCPLQDRVSDEAAFLINRNASDRVPDTRSSPNEVEWLFRECSADGDDRVQP